LLPSKPQSRIEAIIKNGRMPFSLEGCVHASSATHLF
jgi:hypothetical protein